MQINKWGYNFNLPNDWLREANFTPFTLAGEYYTARNCEDIFIVNIVDISPNIRGKGVPIFKSGKVDGVFRTARERTVFILKALVEGRPLLEPVRVVEWKGSGRYKFKIVYGCHRLHCSIAAGFTKIPAVWGFDINDPCA